MQQLGLVSSVQDGVIVGHSQLDADEALYLSSLADPSPMVAPAVPVSVPGKTFFGPLASTTQSFLAGNVSIQGVSSLVFYF